MSTAGPRGAEAVQWRPSASGSSGPVTLVCVGQRIAERITRDFDWDAACGTNAPTLGGIELAGAVRRKPDSGYAAGDETKARILAAALDLFAQKGFDGATTRDIAARSDVPLPSIQYYFGNKEGLYLACLEKVRGVREVAYGPVLDRAHAALARKAPIADLVGIYCEIMDVSADVLFAGSMAQTRALFLARHNLPGRKQRGPSAGMDKTYACCERLIHRISGGAYAGDRARLAVFTINGQLVALYVGRRQFTAAEDRRYFTPRRIADLKAIVRQQTQLLLGAYADPKHPLNNLSASA